MVVPVRILDKASSKHMLAAMKTLPVLGAITMMLGGITAAENQPAAGFFPFTKGRYWLYDGTVKFMQGAEVKEQKITGWKSEVVDTVAGKGFKAALLKGSPQDLAWYEEGKERGDVIVVLTRDGTFHDIHGGEEVAKKFAEIKAVGTLPAGLIDSETILFKTSMKMGDRFGDPEQTQLGPRYCWVVTDISMAKPDHPVRGAPADKDLTSYTLTFRTNPDHANLIFTRDLGITFYEYVHHGTKGDCEMRLVETGDSKSGS